jgi:glyoxylase-like metal-dependent hydrolase (beta-lactamase superfamily II)
LKLSIKTIVTGPFQENTYLLIDKLSDKCILLDPGDEGQKIINYINENDLIPIAIINTHAHLDHIGAIAEIKEKYLIPFYLHVDEKPILDSFLIACRMYGLKKGNPPSVDKWINSSGDLVIGPFKLSIIETPGHTPGGCSYLINDVIFVGDTLFKGSIGRTDLPGGDRKVLDASLIKLMKTLSPKTTVYSGHGPLTSISTEKTNNPFLIPLQNQLG